MQKPNKAGMIGLNQVVGIIVLLLIAGIMLTVGLRVDDEMQSILDDESITFNVINMSTIANVNETPGTYIQNTTWDTSTLRRCSLTVIEATNRSGAPGLAAFTANNYTVTDCLINYTGGSGDDKHNNTRWNITGSVTYYQDTPRYNASESIMERKTNVSENQGLLGTIIIFGVIISVVTIAFMIGRT